MTKQQTLLNAIKRRNKLLKDHVILRAPTVMTLNVLERLLRALDELDSKVEITKVWNRDRVQELATQITNHTNFLNTHEMFKKP